MDKKEMAFIRVADGTEGIERYRRIDESTFELGNDRYKVVNAQNCRIVEIDKAHFAVIKTHKGEWK
jgi:hypothetical protein